MVIPGNKVLIQPTAPIDQLPSGLYLPESAVQRPNTGKIIALGTEADESLLHKEVMYNPVVAVSLPPYHLVHVLEIKFIL
jgi:co-chaperonin GroES (HSP10)